MTGNVNRFQNVGHSIKVSHEMNSEKKITDSTFTDAKIKNSQPYKRIRNDKGQEGLQFKKIEGMTDKKIEKSQAKVKEGKQRVAVLDEYQKDRIKVSVDENEKGDIAFIQVVDFTNGVKKVKNYAQDQFEIERMDAEEYERIRGVFLDRLQQIIKQRKDEEQKDLASLEGRASYLKSHHKFIDTSKKTKGVVGKEKLDFKNQKVLSDAAISASKEVRRERDKQEKLDEKHEETNREAVKTDVKKRDIRKREIKKQTKRRNDIQKDDAAPAA
jgi:hypothetical protein